MTEKRHLFGALVLVLLLAGCSNGPEPMDLTDPTPVAATTPAPATPMTTWSYTLDDGTEVTITDDGGKTSFTGDVPTPISIIDAADCTGLLVEMDHWSKAEGSTPEGANRLLAYYEYATTRWYEKCLGGDTEEVEEESDESLDRTGGFESLAELDCDKAIDRGTKFILMECTKKGRESAWLYPTQGDTSTLKTGWRRIKAAVPHKKYSDRGPIYYVDHEGILFLPGMYWGDEMELFWAGNALDYMKPVDRDDL